MQVALTDAMPSSEGRDLALRHRYGDPAAFEEIYRRYAEMVFGLALRIGGDRELAAEMTQETFLRVFRHLAKFRGHASLRTWIYRIALNCCRSRLRRRGRRAVEEPTERLERLADERASPEQIAAGREAGRHLTAAIAGLPLAFREAVVLRDVEQLSYAEIATVLGVRIGTVRSRIARGRERLRRALEEIQ